MKKMTKALALVTLGIAIVLPAVSYGKCVLPEKDNESWVTKKFTESKAVVLAKVQTEKTVGSLDYETQTAQWKVLKTWKGNLRTGASFSTSSYVGCCDMNDKVAKDGTYLLYLLGAPFQTTTCSFTMTEKEAAFDLSVLDRTTGSQPLWFFIVPPTNSDRPTSPAPPHKSSPAAAR
ncbi:MAG: hypothetical protein JNN20_10060 [Betaproteobacteria bacterium]|nr:hypothetical protein [Betaproteobacteria bacterium]